MDDKMAVEKKSKAVRILGIAVKCIVLLIVILAVVCIAGIAYLTMSEYIPDAYTFLETENESSETVGLGQEIKLLSWNIGYAGLGKEADFFMDGGKNVTSYDADGVQANLDKVIAELQSVDADVVMLQEVDIDSTRTYGINEVEQIGDSMDGYAYSFAYNFNATYVPYPLPPIGRVQSGITTLTKYEQEDAQRISLPCPFSWPIRIANLKRCLLVSRIPIEGSDEDLVIINLHLEAYDDGEGKVAQTRELMEIFKGEIEKGNYVIAGGDFNQIFSSVDEESNCAPLIDESYWQPDVIDDAEFADIADTYMDADVPSCRSLDKVLAGNEDDEDFQYYIIDGFIVSKNITVESFAAQDLGFEASDHNPVVMTVTLDGETTADTEEN